MEHSSASVTLTVPARLGPLVVSAALLERLEHELQAPEAGQYRALVAQVQRQLADTPLDEALEQLLNTFPALSSVYENLRYAQAGLCRHPLEASLHGEMAAAALIGRLRSRPH